MPERSFNIKLYEPQEPLLRRKVHKLSHSACYSYCIFAFANTQLMGDRLLPIFSYSRDVSLYISSGSLSPAPFMKYPFAFPDSVSATGECSEPKFETITTEKQKQKSPSNFCRQIGCEPFMDVGDYHRPAAQIKISPYFVHTRISCFIWEPLICGLYIPLPRRP